MTDRKILLHLPKCEVFRVDEDGSRHFLQTVTDFVIYESPDAPERRKPTGPTVRMTIDFPHYTEGAIMSQRTDDRNKMADRIAGMLQAFFEDRAGANDPVLKIEITEQNLIEIEDYDGTVYTVRVEHKHHRT